MAERILRVHLRRIACLLFWTCLNISPIACSSPSPFPPAAPLSAIEVECGNLQFDFFFLHFCQCLILKFGRSNVGGREKGQGERNLFIFLVNRPYYYYIMVPHCLFWQLLFEVYFSCISGVTSGCCLHGFFSSMILLYGCLLLTLKKASY